jgi:hypothetical protein
MGSSSRRAAIEEFYKNVLESSSEEEFDGETKLLIPAAAMVNKHYLMRPCMGCSSKKQRRSRSRSLPPAPLQGLL